jgi:hypothetical protein
MLKHAVLLLSLPRRFLMVSAHPRRRRMHLLWINVDDLLGDAVTMYYGNATSATYCIDDGNGGSTNYYESISPPTPPPPYWDVRWKGVRTTSGDVCIVDGLFPRDYRAIPLPANTLGRDTFRLTFGYVGSPETNAMLTWPDVSYLQARCDSMFFTYVDKNDFTFHKVDMFAQTRTRFRPRQSTTRSFA